MYVLLKGKLNALRVKIVGVYAPNKAQAPFWEKVCNELLDGFQDSILMSGDFNAVLDPKLDRSSDSPISRFPSSFRNCKKRTMFSGCVESD